MLDSGFAFFLICPITNENQSRCHGLAGEWEVTVRSHTEVIVVHKNHQSFNSIISWRLMCLYI